MFLVILLNPPKSIGFCSDHFKSFFFIRFAKDFWWQRAPWYCNLNHLIWWTKWPLEKRPAQGFEELSLPFTMYLDFEMNENRVKNLWLGGTDLGIISNFSDFSSFTFSVSLRSVPRDVLMCLSCRIETLLRASLLDLGIYLPCPCLIGLSFLEPLRGYPFVS